MSKLKTLTLIYQPAGLADKPRGDYQVAKITNSTEYAPGYWLTKKEVDDLCEAKGWAVTITGA